MQREDSNNTGENRRSSPVAWAVGGVFILAVIATIFFYDGRNAVQQTTTTTPSNAPSVTTGSNNPANANK